jgi:hypothetical protein
MRRKYVTLTITSFAVGLVAQTNTQPGMGSASQGVHEPQETTAIEGCVVRQNTEYFTFLKSGEAVHVSPSGEHASAHLGHLVRLHGTEQPSTSTSNVGTSGGTSGTATNELVVHRIDMVSGTCPNDIQEKATSSGISTSRK